MACNAPVTVSAVMEAIPADVETGFAAGIA
jgi:hypothetical protein